MPAVNKTILASAFIITGAGLYHFYLTGASKNTNGHITPILVGGYMLAIFASFFDLIGFGIGQVAGYILLLAVGVSLYSVILDLTARLAKQQKNG